MIIERKDVGFGKYQWFIDNQESDLPETTILQMVAKEGKEKELWAKWNYYRFFTIEI